MKTKWFQRSTGYGGLSVNFWNFAKAADQNILENSQNFAIYFWDKLIQNESSKVCGRQLLINLICETFKF